MQPDHDNIVFRALADSTRRQLIDDLSAKNGQTLFELCTRLIHFHGIHMTRQSISKHLDILEAADLIKIERKGRTKVHYLNTEPIKRIGRNWLSHYL